MYIEIKGRFAIESKPSFLRQKNILIAVLAYFIYTISILSILKRENSLAYIGGDMK